LEKIIPIKNTTNQMNPTFAFIITPSGAPNSISKETEVFACPQSLMPLRKLDSCYYCEKSFLAYPIIEGIPVLKQENSVLASHLLS
jgi:uncharacterized protein YbaR (Trm112 family)